MKAMHIVGLKTISAAVLALTLGTVVQAQNNNVGEYSVGGSLGATDRDDFDMTYGVEFEYQKTPQWSYGMVVERTPDVVRDDGATVLLGTANFRPETMSRLKLTGGAGVQFRQYADDGARFRVGAAYDLVVEGPLTIAPKVSFDFGEGQDGLVLGAAAFYRF